MAARSGAVGAHQFFDFDDPIVLINLTA